MLTHRRRFVSLTSPLTSPLPSSIIAGVVASAVFVANPLALAGLGLGVGLLAGFFGIGGGSLLVPLMHVLLHVPFDLAVGTGVTATVVAAVSGALTHWRNRNVCWSLAGVLAIAGVVMVTPGVETLEYLKSISRGISGVTPLDWWLSGCYFVLLGLIGVMVLREASAALRRPPRGGVVQTPVTRLVGRIRLAPRCHIPGMENNSLSVWPIAALGALGGYVSGLLGIGGGPFIVPALIYILGVPTRYAVGSALVSVVAMVTSGALQHWHRGNVSIASAAVLALAAAIGAMVGARIHSATRPARVRQWFGVVVLAIACSVALKLYLRIRGL